MSSSTQTKPLNITERQSIIEEFIEYCSIQRGIRQNSGEPFDTERFDQAVEIALQKLTRLQKEGWA